MLEKIKSSYFIKILFSILTDSKQLNLVKYNKAIQNKLNININNYKILYGKYIIYEENGKGKEYNKDGKLRFRGEYLNDERIKKNKFKLMYKSLN